MIDKTLTSSPWTTPMDYLNGLPPKIDIPNEYHLDYFKVVRCHTLLNSFFLELLSSQKIDKKILL